MRIILTFILLTSTCYAEGDWKWAGFEILGNKTVSKHEIQKIIPLKIGTTYQLDQEKWKEWCQSLVQKFSFHNAYCSAVKYISFESYFMVNVVEQGDEERDKYREPPSGDIKLADEKVLDTYEKLQSRLWELFNDGIGVQEDSSQGYLDYGDSQMSTLVAKLVKLVPPYADNLIEVLKNDQSDLKRAKAATLLNWARQTKHHVSIVHTLLDDPAMLVRNNISRFMLHYLGSLEDREVRKLVIKSLAKQMRRPSHADRNKSLYGLVEIAENFVDDRPYIKDYAFSEIKYLAENSIVENVQGPAKKLVKYLDR